MLPEISHRCLSCGASVRAGARFCPQCGERMERDAPQSPDGEPKARAVESPDALATTTGSVSRGAESYDALFEEDWNQFETNIQTKPEPDSEPVLDMSANDRRVDRPETLAGTGDRPVEELPSPPSPSPPVTTARPAPRPPSASGPVSQEPLEEVAGASGRAAGEAAGAGAHEAEPERAASRVTRAAAVRESLRPRVERVREVSIVVLEETPDDSGLRFVLIAVLLFILFLVFLFLHTFLK